ncbi:MAG: amidohydrolase [Planctomycetes bacterium RBG_13_60_9]|nr:MAG: amidohydrolase [Planctomycetes bacterium RBG_13_60_9]
MAREIIDFHTHAFPDALAARAMKALLEEAPGIKAYLDGTVGDLLRSMDRSGIETSVVCCIATKAGQFEPILRWCREIRSERLIPFPSVHPADPACADVIRRIAEEGFPGVKLHPFYQDFFADEDRMLHFYEEVSRHGLLLVMHTGYDIAFPRIRRADPRKLVAIRERFPDLRFVSTHLGAWQQWDEVREHVMGREIYMEISFAVQDLGLEATREIILRHPDEYVLFGTDSPWTDQAETLNLLEKLDLPHEKLQRILAGNAARLLGLAS